MYTLYIALACDRAERIKSSPDLVNKYVNKYVIATLTKNSFFDLSVRVLRSQARVVIVIRGLTKFDVIFSPTTSRRLGIGKTLSGGDARAAIRDTGAINLGRCRFQRTYLFTPTVYSGRRAQLGQSKTNSHSIKRMWSMTYLWPLKNR